MKKLISIIITTMLVLGVLCVCNALAAAPTVEVARGDNNTTVTVVANTLQADEETTILVVDKDVSISQAFANTTTIKHIDQTTASEEGVATFKFMYAENAGLDVYVGYATMAADAEPVEDVVDEVKTEDPVDPPVDPNPDEPGEDPVVPTFTYGDVNNDAAIDVADAVNVINNFLRGAEFIDVNTEEVYPYGVQAADVNADDAVDVPDAVAIINNFLRGTEFEANAQ